MAAQKRSVRWRLRGVALARAARRPGRTTAPATAPAALATAWAASAPGGPCAAPAGPDRLHLGIYRSNVRTYISGSPPRGSCLRRVIALLLRYSPR